MMPNIIIEVVTILSKEIDTLLRKISEIIFSSHNFVKDENTLFTRTYKMDKWVKGERKTITISFDGCSISRIIIDICILKRDSCNKRSFTKYVDLNDELDVAEITSNLDTILKAYESKKCYEEDFLVYLFLRFIFGIDVNTNYYISTIKELNDTIDDLNKQVKFLTDRLNDK